MEAIKGDVLYSGEACVVKEIGKRARVEEVRDHPWLVGWQSVGEMMKIVKEMKAE